MNNPEKSDEEILREFAIGNGWTPWHLAILAKTLCTLETLQSRTCGTECAEARPVELEAAKRRQKGDPDVIQTITVERMKDGQFIITQKDPPIIVQGCTPGKEDDAGRVVLNLLRTFGPHPIDTTHHTREGG